MSRIEVRTTLQRTKRKTGRANLDYQIIVKNMKEQLEKRNNILNFHIIKWIKNLCFTFIFSSNYFTILLFPFTNLTSKIVFFPVNN